MAVVLEEVSNLPERVMDEAVVASLILNRSPSELRSIRESLSALGLSTKAFVAVSLSVGPKSARSSLEPAFGFPQPVRLLAHC